MVRCCQTRSGLPSLSKSAAVTILQAVSDTAEGVKRAVDVIDVPFMNHTPIQPVVRCCQTRSGLPSPSKSATPAICQFVSATNDGVSRVDDVMAVPFMNHALNCPVVRCCQRRSGFPSALKSATPAILQSVSAAAEGVKRVVDVMAVPFMNHAPIQPAVWCCQTRSGLPSALRSWLSTAGGEACPPSYTVTVRPAIVSPALLESSAALGATE